jgi:hypothetical protein
LRAQRQPAARLSAVTPAETGPRIGIAKGLFLAPDDFNALDKEISALFLGHGEP